MKSFLRLMIFNIIFVAALAIYPEFALASGQNFVQVKTDHFIINYDSQVDKSYISKMQDIAEKYYRIITQEFDLIRDELWLWDNRANIFIAKDKDSYLSEFKCFSWSAACVDYQGKNIYTYSGQPYFFPIFIHELTHIIFRELVGYSNFPLWLDEGVAVYMEDKYGGGRYKNQIKFLTGQIQKEDYIKLPQLSRVTSGVLNNKSDDYVKNFYVESFSIVNFLIKRYGQHNFSNLLSLLKKGYSVDEALSRSFYGINNYSELEKEWKKFYQK